MSARKGPEPFKRPDGWTETGVDEVNFHSASLYLSLQNPKKFNRVFPRSTGKEGNDAEFAAVSLGEAFQDDPDKRAVNRRGKDTRRSFARGQKCK